MAIIKVDISRNLTHPSVLACETIGTRAKKSERICTSLQEVSCRDGTESDVLLLSLPIYHVHSLLKVYSTLYPRC